MDLNESLRLDLSSATARIEAQNKEMLSLLREIEEGQICIHPTTQAIGRVGNLRVAEIRQVNAALFESRPDDAERKLRLALDDALRRQMALMKKLLELPPREG